MADERGQKLADAMFGPAFGFFPQMKPKRSKQDPEAAKNVPIDVARGFAAGALGAPGDIESLIRLLPGLDKKTILPTSEEILQRIPGGSDTPTSRAVAGAGTLAGGFYTGPGSGVRAALSLPSAIKRAGQDFAMAAGQSGSKIFIGPKAKTWNQAAADLAVQLEKSGVDPVDIWRQTGTFRGADGILRQEISDVGVIHRNPDQLKELGKNKLEEARELGLRLFGTPGQKDLFPKALTEAKKPVREQVKRLKEEVDELNRHSGEVIEGGLRGLFGLDPQEGAGARGMEAYRNMAAASSSPTPLALAALPAGVVKGVKGLAKAEKAAVVPLDIPLAKVKTPHERSLEQGYEHGWYHGTTGDVRSFDPKLRGETTGARSAQKGFFFVRDPQNPPEKMLVKSSDPQSVELMRKLGYADEQIAQQNKVSFEGHGAETASGYASLGGSRTYKEAMRKANAAERRGDWPEYEKQMSIAEDAEIGLSQELQSLVAKYGDVRDEMLDKIQKAVYDRQLPQAEAEALDQWYKSVMPYGWYNTFGTDKFFDNLSKELVKKVGEERAAPALEAMKQFLSVRNERALMEKTQEGSNVMPIALRYKKPYVYDYEGSSYRDESYSDLIDKALAGGHDALILKNTYDPGVGPAKLVDIGVVFDPAQIRSRFAKFNPENIQSSDITKAKGGAIKKIKISDNPDTMRLELMKAKG